MRKKSELSELTENPVRILVIIVLSVFLSLLILLSAKYQSDNFNTPQDNFVLELTSENFPTIQLGHYALWGIADNTSFFLKRFNSIDKQLVGLDGQALEELEVPDGRSFEAFMVTIENEGDRNEVPNNFTLMKTAIKNNEANLLFDITIPDSENTFILATPTDGNQTINEQSGIWFVDSDLTKKGLNLQELANTPFKYEARIINIENNVNLSLGRFSDPETSDDSQIFSQALEGFKFPGEDLLRNLPEELEPPINLANGQYKVIISLEPNTDDTDITGSDIFLPILETEIPEDLEPYENYPLKLTYAPIKLNIKIHAE